MAFLLTFLSLRVVGLRACLVTYLFLSGVLLIATALREKYTRGSNFRMSKSLPFLVSFYTSVKQL